MPKFAALLLLILFSGTAVAQKLKYKADIEPIVTGPRSLSKLKVLETYYQQNLGPNKKPVPQTITALKDKMALVCMFAGTALESNASQLKEYPTTDSAVALLYSACGWYNRGLTDYYVKNDTLKAHIAKLELQIKEWKATEQATIKKLLAEKEKLAASLNILEGYNAPKTKEFRAKYAKIVYLNEYLQANKEVDDFSQTILKNLEYEKKIEEQKQQAAQEKKAFVMAQQENERKQHEFLMLQEACAKDNPCPNCPLDVALAFRTAYYAGDIATMKSMIVDYYGDGNIFYNTKLDIFKSLSPEEEKKLKLQIRAKTADYKITEPAGAVYYTNNEDKDFFIDKNYKSYRLHATVFQIINDFDKIDLIKYNGEWKVYRVGGAYSGRSGRTIISGRFFFDPTFLQKETKVKAKK